MALMSPHTRGDAFCGVRCVWGGRRRECGRRGGCELRGGCPWEQVLSAFLLFPGGSDEHGVQSGDCFPPAAKISGFGAADDPV